jgi:signal transduction histidine kinase
MANSLDEAIILEHLGAGVLVFNAQQKLIFDNRAAHKCLGTNFVLVRSEGWPALEMLINAQSALTRQAPSQELRERASKSETPIRFRLLLSGVYTPCWLSVFRHQNETFTQVVIESPDWSALGELMETFRAEARSAINDTNGHADFLRNLMMKPPSGLSAAQLGERSLGMIDLISTKMYRLQHLVDLLHRLEIIRTGQLAADLERGRKKVNIEDFLEDFIEEINEVSLIDPSIKTETYRHRVTFEADENLYAYLPKSYLRNILRDVLRNAIMYSEPDSPVKVRVFSASQGRHIQFDVIDQGCGIRAKETERVFEPFQRARQPQVMRENGYGLSLYLVKAELETLGGRIWFQSEEGAGTTFSFKVPAFISPSS